MHMSMDKNMLLQRELMFYGPWVVSQVFFGFDKEEYYWIKLTEK